MELAVVDVFREIQTGEITELPSQVYILIAILSIFEGPLTTLTGAAAASMGLLNPGMVFLSASTGNLAGDFFWYSLGRAGNLKWFLRGSRRFGFDPDRLEWFKYKIRDHAPKIIFLAKVTSSFTVPALISIGLVQLSWRRWFPALVMAEILWSGSLITVGYFATQTISEMAVTIKFLPLFGILFVCFFIAMTAARRVFH